MCNELHVYFNFCTIWFIDFLQLNDSSYIFGNLIFEDVSLKFLNIKDKTINGLPFSDIVTTLNPQIIRNEKVFSRLVAKSVLTDHVTGVSKIIFNGSFLNLPLKITTDYVLF